MRPKNEGYHIAWILSSPDQYEAARGQFDDPYEWYSFGMHITYTLGTAGYHDVVMASPASRTDIPTVEIIINDLLQHYPSVRAGFVISTDAYVPRNQLARVGDVVVGTDLQDMSQCVFYVDAEKTNREKRISMTGQSGNIPVAVAEAIEKLGGRQQVFISEERKPQVLHGPIASSAQQIKASAIEDTAIIDQKRFICFETAASTMKTRPFILLAGVTNYCEENGDDPVRQQTCKAVLLYLAQLTKHINHHALQDEREITEYFEYEALDLERPACRLLKLEGGIGELRCQIFQAYLPSDNKTLSDKIEDETMIIPYDALSYCWGSNKLTKSIRVNGKILPITSNLFRALGYLRHEDRDRILWIDAICIDQRNNLERGHQVDIMGRLYSQADEVLIWLGNIGDDTGSLVSVLQKFEANVPLRARREWTSEDIRYRLLWVQAQYLSLEEQGSLQSKLYRLMNNPWFRRVWVVQEVANAKKASLGCTDGWVDARTFAVIPKLLDVTPNTQCQAIIDIIPGVSRMSSWYGQGPNLSTLLWRFRESQATDPRDKLYALLGISSDKPIAPDYNKTEKDVVKDMMEYLSYGGQWNFGDFRITRINEIPEVLSKGLEQFILHGGDLDNLTPLTTRHMAPLVLTTATTNYLRYVRPRFLAQLEQLGSQVPKFYPRISAPAGSAISLASLLGEEKSLQVSAELLNLASQNGMGFARMILDRDGDDIAINPALAIEAISHGPNMLERFLDKYGKKASSSGDGSQMVLGVLQRLKGSYTHAGVFFRNSDTLKQRLQKRLQKSMKSLADENTHERIFRRKQQTVNDAVAIITEDELRSMCAELEAFLQHADIQVIDEDNIKNIRGGQYMMDSFLNQIQHHSSWSKNLMEALISTYSVEIFLSSCVRHVEIMVVDMWPTSITQWSNPQNDKIVDIDGPIYRDAIRFLRKRRRYSNGRTYEDEMEDREERSQTNSAFPERLKAWRLLIPCRFIRRDDNSEAEIL